MNQKQLANVLVKILGLSLCAHGAVALVAAVIGFPFAIGTTIGSKSFFPAMISVTYSIVPFAIGLWLLLGSKWFVEKFFKDE